MLVTNGCYQAELYHASEHMGSNVTTSWVIAKYSVSSSSRPSGVLRPVLIVT